jgi:CRP/FNR family transcriptional regulator, cyclic AMP receptor protein
MAGHSERFEHVRAESARLRAQSIAVHESFQRIRAALQNNLESAGAGTSHSVRLAHESVNAHQFWRPLPGGRAGAAAESPQTQPALSGLDGAGLDGAVDRYDSTDLPPADSLAATPERWRQPLREVLETALPWISLPKREALARAMRLRTVARRGRIADNLELRSRVYLVVSGEAKLGFVSSVVTRRLLAILSAGDFLGAIPAVGEDGEYPDRPIRSYYCDAISDCLVAQVDPADLGRLLPGIDTQVLVEALDRTAGRWLRLLLWRYGVSELDVRGRLLANLTALCGRFGIQDERGSTINLRVTESDLAQLIGASRSKVSTSLSMLEREGLVIRNRRRLIVTHKALRPTVQNGTLELR